MAKLLNQGAYGCVYYPGFTCKGNQDKAKKFITKLEIYDKTSKNEIEVSNKIKKIKNYHNFFSPIIKHCISRFNEINKNRDKLQDCEAVNIDQHIYSDFILNYIKYIKSKDIDKYLLSIEVPAIFLKKILSNYNFVLNSIKILQDNNIIHFDLHTGNILYSIKNNIPIIIDFGLSIDITKLVKSKNTTDYLQVKKLTLHYSPKHYTYPPELHFITYLLKDVDVKNLEEKLNKKISKEEINTFVGDIFQENKIQKRYIYYKLENSNISLDKYAYEKELTEYYKKFINKTKKQAIDSLLETIQYLDNYTATIDFLVILIKKLDKVLLQNYGQNNIFSKILFFILELLSINLTVDIEKRFSL